MEKEAAKQRLLHIANRVRVCHQCSVHTEASGRPTPASGGPSSVVFIGRNPGIQERDAGAPFIGKTKSAMDAMIDSLGYDRSNLYITNLVKCYTSNPKPDRPPTTPEINFCGGLYLEHELSAIEPKLAVTFGKDPWCFLMRDNPAVKTCTGFTGRPYLTPRYNFVIWPLFHPGMLLHDPLKYKAKMEEDFGVLYTFCRDRGYLGPLAKPL